MADKQPALIDNASEPLPAFGNFLFKCIYTSELKTLTSTCNSLLMVYLRLAPYGTNQTLFPAFSKINSPNSASLIVDRILSTSAADGGDDPSALGSADGSPYSTSGPSVSSDPLRNLASRLSKSDAAPELPVTGGVGVGKRTPISSPRLSAGRDRIFNSISLST